MIWIFKTHTVLNGTYRLIVLRWCGYVVYEGPQLLKVVANDIEQADAVFEAETGINPCKLPKGSPILVTRFCPELKCNGSHL